MLLISTFSNWHCNVKMICFIRQWLHLNSMHILNVFQSTRYDSISCPNISESDVYKFHYAKFSRWWHTIVHLLEFMCMCIELGKETASTNLNTAQCNTRTHDTYKFDQHILQLLNGSQCCKIRTIIYKYYKLSIMLLNIKLWIVDAKINQMAVMYSV